MEEVNLHMTYKSGQANTLVKNRAMIAFGISNPPDPRPLMPQMQPFITPRQFPNQPQEPSNPNQPQEPSNPNQPQEPLNSI